MNLKRCFVLIPIALIVLPANSAPALDFNNLEPGLYDYVDPASGKPETFYRRGTNPYEDPMALPRSPLPPEYLPLVTNAPAPSAQRPYQPNPPLISPPQKTASPAAASKLKWLKVPALRTYNATKAVTYGILGIASSMGGGGGSVAMPATNWLPPAPAFSDPSDDSLGDDVSTSTPSPWLPPMRGQSSANIFGGYNISNGAGLQTTTMKNIFGGQNIFHPGGGMTTTMPNIFGGYNIMHAGGGMSTTSANIFGGQNINWANGRTTTTMPNIFGGQNIYSPSGRMTTTTPNVFGGYNSFP